ncbi:multisubunit sodium/proton antiporter MrpB subunit [Dietzia kunjamensis]|uniref:hydrogenase subunit MbhD domain-containing protein n=1 Tax=Dietzia kunjamensis TaxID=322509 RepID=UPI000E738EFD|nr:hydrogenase subunit MbhD domain-containing protein [Dietzia kunjamensis]RKE65384.1 multisubunit sodium/proton antiporter MrpB subunit [Dietzia kunjamensis]
MTGPGVVDIVVGLAVLIAAAVALTVRDRLTSVVTFILLGVLLAALWTAERAPDVALAEAAIGTGVTGALLVDAVADRGATRASSGRGRGRLLAWAAAAIGGAGLVVVLIAGVLAADGSGGAAPLTRTVDEAMPSAAVSHDITAVLLDFRAYDTLLEVAVILVAVVGAYALASAMPPDAASGAAPGAASGAASGAGSRAARPPAATLVDFLRLAAPVLLLLAAWLLFAGAYQPGGAFQGGAMLAGTAILAAGAGAAPTLLEGFSGRVTISLGPLAFLAAGGAGALFAGHWLHMPPGVEAPATVAVEAALAVSIGAALATLFLTVRRRPQHIHRGDRV